MFHEASSFNQPLSSWQTTSVTDMKSMLDGAHTFNQPIGSWSTAAVTNMHAMFRHASVFNQPLGSWDMSAVVDVSYMFYGASAFDQPLDSWNMSALTDASLMFQLGRFIQLRERCGRAGTQDRHMLNAQVRPIPSTRRRWTPLLKSTQRRPSFFILRRSSPARRVKPDSDLFPAFAPPAQRGITQRPASPNVRNAQREPFPPQIGAVARTVPLGHIPWSVVTHALFRSCCISVIS